MAQYEMLVSRRVEQWKKITIDADTHQEARDIAEECGNDSETPDGTPIEWESDHWNLDVEVTINKINGEEVDETMLEDEEEDEDA